MTLVGDRSLRRKIQHMKDNLGDEVVQSVRNGADRTSAEAKRQVATGNNVWRGNLIRSISARKTADAESVTRYEISADVPYAPYVEYGTGPRGDPTAPTKFQFSSPSESDWEAVYSDILNWVNTKPIFTRPRTPAQAAKITETIIKFGTTPHPYMRPAWFKNRDGMVRDAGLRARKVVRRG